MVAVETPALDELRNALAAVIVQDDRIDGKFREWMENGCSAGGAIAQRNMERKRDRLAYRVTDALHAPELVAEVGDDAAGELEATAGGYGYGRELRIAVDRLRATVRGT